MNPREDRYFDTAPPPGWQPKSAFFKAIWTKAHFDLANKRVAILCPHCGQDITLRLTVLTDYKNP